jgi:hypothetical protein
METDSRHSILDSLFYIWVQKMFAIYLAFWPSFWPLHNWDKCLKIFIDFLGEIDFMQGFLFAM